MTTSDIKALTDDVDAGHYYECNEQLITGLRAAIETLLAREAEVLKAVPDAPLRNPQNPNETELAIWRERNEIRRRIRAILNQEK